MVPILVSGACCDVIAVRHTLAESRTPYESLKTSGILDTLTLTVTCYHILSWTRGTALLSTLTTTCLVTPILEWSTVSVVPLGRTHTTTEWVTDKSHCSVRTSSWTDALALACVAIVEGKARIDTNVTIIWVLWKSVNDGSGRREIAIVEVDCDAVAATERLKLDLGDWGPIGLPILYQCTVEVDSEVSSCSDSEEDGTTTVCGEGDGVIGEPIAIVDWLGSWDGSHPNRVSSQRMFI
jgi:hypothetical protein